MDDKRKGEPSFSLNDFKKWMASQNDAPSHHEKARRSPYIGLQVESKLGVKRLVHKMLASEDCDVHELAQDFRREGGIVVGAEGENLVIEVDSGTFQLPKFFVRKVK